MTRLLHVAVSPRNAASISRRVAGNLIDGLPRSNVSVVLRDLARTPPPHPDAAFVSASLMREAERGDAERHALALSETLIGELEEADAVLLSTPMHNFTVPSALKAWLDLIVRPHRTFAITASGKIGLLADRPVLIVVACGGGFDTIPGAQIDFLGPYLRYVLGVIGLSDIRILRLEDLNRGSAKRERSLGAARDWVSTQSATVCTHLCCSTKGEGFRDGGGVQQHGRTRTPTDGHG